VIDDDLAAAHAALDAARRAHEADLADWQGERTRFELEAANLRAIAEPFAEVQQERRARIKVALLTLHTECGVSVNKIRVAAKLICEQICRVDSLVLPSRSTLQRRVYGLGFLGQQQVAGHLQQMAEARAPVNLCADGGSVGGQYVENVMMGGGAAGNLLMASIPGTGRGTSEEHAASIAAELASVVANGAVVSA